MDCFSGEMDRFNRIDYYVDDDFGLLVFIDGVRYDKRFFFVVFFC